MEAAVKIPVSMTVDEFLDWWPGDGQRWQLVDGQPQAMAPASSTHAAVQAELIRLLGNHLADQRSPCRVMIAPGVVPRVRAQHNVRIPDLAVTCAPASSDGRLLEDAVLIAEILSPSNQPETWANVWAYTTIPSVQEILILRTAAIRADLLRRNPDGTWPQRPETIEKGELRLASIGFATPLADIYRTSRLNPAS
jgi:Uma2 family endonuclease